MSQVNLLPREILQRQRYRRRSALVGLIGAGLLALLVLFFLFQANTLRGVQSDIDEQETANATIQVEIDGLQEFATLRLEAEEAEAMLARAFAGEIAFSGILMDLSRVIPSDAYLQDLSVQITSTQGGTEPGAEIIDPAAVETGAGLVGVLSANGRAADIEAVSTFLTRLGNVTGWENPWSSTVTAEEGGIVTFSLTVDLSDLLVTLRGLEAAELPPLAPVVPEVPADGTGDTGVPTDTGVPEAGR